MWRWRSDVPGSRLYFAFLLILGQLSLLMFIWRWSTRGAWPFHRRAVFRRIATAAIIGPIMILPTVPARVIPLWPRQRPAKVPRRRPSMPAVRSSPAVPVTPVCVVAALLPPGFPSVRVSTIAILVPPVVSILIPAVVASIVTTSGPVSISLRPRRL